MRVRLRPLEPCAFQGRAELRLREDDPAGDEKSAGDERERDEDANHAA